MGANRLSPFALPVLLLAACAAQPPPARRTAPPPAVSERARAAVLYREGRRALDARPPDVERASRLMQQAAELGDPEAQHVLALSHLSQPDGEGDPTAGFAWLRRAAQAGHVPAMLRLGRALEQGDGLARDPAWAVVWFHRAAERGSAEARYAFALLLVAGIGTAPDEALALAELTLAERAGHAEAARYRAALAPRVAPERVGPAMAMAGRRAGGAVRVPDGPLVRFAQSALAAVGPDGSAVDGADGPRTRAALLAFARSEGLAASPPYGDGVIDRLRQRAGPLLAAGAR